MAERTLTTRQRRFIYVPGDVDQDTPVTVRVTANVRGAGVRVRPGSTASATQTETFTVTRVLRDLVAPSFVIKNPQRFLEGLSLIHI